MKGGAVRPQGVAANPDGECLHARTVIRNADNGPSMPLGSGKRCGTPNVRGT